LEFIRSTFPAGALPRLPAFLVHRHAKPTGFTVSMLYCNTVWRKSSVLLHKLCFFYVFLVYFEYFRPSCCIYQVFLQVPVHFCAQKMQDAHSSCIVVTK